MENPASSLWSTAWPRAWPVTGGGDTQPGSGTQEQRRNPSPTPPSPLHAAGEGAQRRATPTQDTSTPLSSGNPKGPWCPQKCPPNGRTVTHPFAPGRQFLPVLDFLGPKQRCGLCEGRRRDPAAHWDYPTRPSGHAVPFQVSRLPGSPRVLLRGACPCVRAQSGRGRRENPPHTHPQGSPGSGVARNWRLRQIHIR